MANKKYLVRLDDACPNMDKKRWNRIEEILDRYSIKPLVGIIPHNEDGETMLDPDDDEFWRKACGWQSKGWTIALHGYNHCCTTSSGGINPVHNRSEFAGLPYQKQLEKIHDGYEILKQNGLNPTYFFAPSHTYDHNTVLAIKEATPIRMISDTMARFPYQYDNEMVVVPCQMGRFRDIPIAGYWTFCFHPNIMDDEAVKTFEQFIIDNQDKFIAFDEIPVSDLMKKGIIDKLMGKAYFAFRKIR